MSTTVSVLFYARKSMANNQGECPIYRRITIAGERYERRYKTIYFEENWSKDTGRMKVRDQMRSHSLLSKPTAINDKF